MSPSGSYGSSNISTDLVLNQLPEGYYYGCSLAVTDSAGNTSTPLSIAPFTVDLTQPNSFGYLESINTSANQASLNLSATDTNGIGSYCISTYSTSPSTSPGCWTNVNPINSFAKNTTIFSYGAADALYIWYKDRAENISSVDSIDLSNCKNNPDSCLDPRSMSGLGLWLDTKNLDGKINTTINNGDSLSKWVDLSRNQYHPTGPDSNRLPTYQDNGLDFSGNYLSFTDDLTFLKNNSFMIIVVEKRHTSATNYIFGSRTWGTNVGFHFGYRDENTFNFAFYGNDTHHTVPSLDSSQTNIVSGIYNKGISDYTQRQHIYFNGEKNLSNSSSAPRSEDLQRTDNIDLRRLWAGRWNGYYDGTVKEVLMFDRPLSEAEVVKINYYLANKWNLSDIVDSDGDGFTDTVEIAKNSDPTNSSKLPSGIPAIVADVKLWLDATNMDGQNNTTIANGNSVDKWKDLSGNSFHATASNGKPTYPQDSLLNKQVMKFSKSESDTMLVDDGLNIQNENYDIFIVERYNNYSGGGRSLQSGDNNWLLGLWGSQYGFYTNGWLGYYSADNNWHLINGKSIGTETLYFNGAFRKTINSGSGRPYRLAINGGGMYAGYSDPSIAELLYLTRC